MAFWRRRPKPIRKVEKKLGSKLSKFDQYVELTEEYKSYCKDTFTKFDIDSKVPIQISPEDIMFLFVLHDHSLRDSINAYFTTGLNGRNIVDKIVKARYGNWSKINSILDFASGYGRVSRHFLNDIDNSKIWVSDIKEESVQWQEDQFTVNGIKSEQNPADFKPPVKFNIIFVGSLFTHLPEILFNKWLTRLIEVLDENGTLIISTFDIGVHGKDYQQPFKYLEMSEDRLFNGLNTSIKGENKYGITYTTPAYMEEKLRINGIDNKRFQRHPLAFGKIQDIYIIGKSQLPDALKLAFTEYP